MNVADVPTEKEAVIVASMVGHTITSAVPYEGEDECGFLGVSLTLDDGRVIDFQGWGYDYWGLTIDEEVQPCNP